MEGLVAAVRMAVAALAAGVQVAIPASSPYGLLYSCSGADQCCYVSPYIFAAHGTGGVTRRKLQTPGTAEEHKRQETPTINPNDHQPAQLTDHAPDAIDKAARESRRITQISTAAVNAFSTATSSHQHPHPTGSSPDPLSQCSPLRRQAG